MSLPSLNKVIIIIIIIIIIITILEFELHTYVSESFRIQRLDALNKNTVPSPNYCC